MSSFVHDHSMPTREDFIKSQGLPNINYFTFDQQQNFIHNLPLVKGATLNTLEQIEQSLTFSNIPLIIPYTSSYNTKWSYEQLEAFAMQGIEVYQNKENGIPQFPYIYNLVGSSKAPGYNTYYERFLTTQQPDPRIYSGRVIGTGFKRGQAYQVPKEQVIISGTKPFEKPERASVFEPKKTLSQNTQNIINGIKSGSLTVPSWFTNNVTWVKSGQITETELINAYNFLSPQEPEITIPPLPEITIPSIPEISAEMELTTTNFQVKLDNKIQFSSSLSNADYNRLKDEMSQEPKITLVFLNQTDFKPISNFYNVLRKIQKLLEGQVVETITIRPTGEIITEPVTTGKPGLMGAGVLGIIGILMLGGFIADHVRKKR